MRYFLRFVCMAFIFFMGTSFAATSSQPSQSWSEFVRELRVEALAQGIRPQVFDEAFKDIKAPNPSVIHLNRSQPEKRLDYFTYRNSRADNYRIQIGRKEFKKHEKVLNEIGQTYKVSPCFIVSLWGLETSYGHYMGNFPVIKSLATLAYNSHRKAFFRKELLLALRVLNEGHVSLKDFKGEWAGASGHPQFMPSSFYKYAVDYDKEGHKDIWKSHTDAFASIANYLSQNGWQFEKPWAITVKLPAGFDESYITNHDVKTIHEWQILGVEAVPGEELPFNQNMPAKIIHPEGGPVMMTFNNFQVIMRWNRSTYYAGTVGYLAEKICQRRL